jgi:glycosyltransferase involved in cell wall biosynthesis
MRISVVTISYNQGRFLRECIESVLGQHYEDLQYIIVDSGSVDGSRQIIEEYAGSVNFIFEPDAGPADGLNKGFAQASGEIFCYLNSDDMLLPGAFSTIASFFRTHPNVDVVCGSAMVINENGRAWRRVYSDAISLNALAYGTCMAVQPSTFFRAESFKRVGGFNANNHSNWDGELLIDMALAGARVASVNQLLSSYRIHGDSITGTGRLDAAHKEYALRMFEKIKGRPFRREDRLRALFYRFLKHARNPRAAAERLIHGPMYRSA